MNRQMEAWGRGGRVRGEPGDRGHHLGALSPRGDRVVSAQLQIDGTPANSVTGRHARCCRVTRG